MQLLRIADNDDRVEDQPKAELGAGNEILSVPDELATADALVEQGSRPSRANPGLLLLDLAGLSFCDARGLSAFVRIANQPTRQNAVLASWRLSLRWRRYCASAA